MPIAHNKKTIFVHIPKNAGTSVIKADGYDFEDLENSHRPATEFRYKFPACWDNYYKFAIVRNPWDRLVSNFEYGRMLKSYWHSADKTTVYGLHPDYLLLKDLSFEETVHLLNTDPKKFNHPGWKMQCHFLCDNSNSLLVRNIFRQESLANNQEFLQLFPNIPHCNSSNRAYTNYMKYYTLETFELVKRIYYEDVVKFNYDIPYSQI
jgi:hypothetical protein